MLFEFDDSIRDTPGNTKSRELVVGTALEYLQTVLPSGTWKQIEGLIADRVVTLPAASREAGRA